MTCGFAKACDEIGPRITNLSKIVQDKQTPYTGSKMG